MVELSQNLEQLANVHLKRIDSRLTTSRRLILSILETSGKPITINEISRQAKNAAQSSLYRNLAVLEEADLVHRVISDHDFAFFELSEHLLGHHHHLRCNKCGTVHDIELSDKNEQYLDQLSEIIAAKMKFKDVHHHLEFIGLCSKCS